MVTTVPEKILASAVELDAEQGTFTAEELIVRCWTKFPDTFGLQGYSDQYPDSNRVLTNIMGTKGLRGKGWLRKVGKKRYRVTDVGRDAALVLNSSGERPVQGKRAGELGRERVDVLERLFTSRALQKFRIRQDLTFGDLSSFWNISARSSANQLQATVTAVDAALSALEALFTADHSSGSIVLPGMSGSITRSDLALAKNLHEHLKAAFTKDLEVIRQRKDERLLR